MKSEGSLPCSQELLFPILSQFNSIYLSAILILSLHLRLGIPYSFSLRFPHQSPVHTCPLSHMCPVIYPSVYFYLIPGIIFGEGYKSRMSLLCTFVLSPVTAPLLDYITQ